MTSRSQHMSNVTGSCLNDRSKSTRGLPAANLLPATFDVEEIPQSLFLAMVERALSVLQSELIFFQVDVDVLKGTL